VDRVLHCIGLGRGRDERSEERPLEGGTAVSGKAGGTNLTPGCPVGDYASQVSYLCTLQSGFETQFELSFDGRHWTGDELLLRMPVTG